MRRVAARDVRSGAMRRGFSGFGAFVAVLAVMGCGGSAKEKDYVREANAICAAANKRLDKLPKPSSLHEIAEVAKREIAIRKEVIAQLGELTPPTDFAGAADNVFKDQEAREERAHAVEKAAEAKNRKKLRKIREEEKTEFGVEAQRARAVGLHDCAGL